LSDRIGKPRLAEGLLLYLVSVALAAAAIIILFSVASISLLDTRKETLTGSRIDNNPIEETLIGTVVSYTDSIVAAVPVQAKSPSEANKLPSSTPVPPPSDIPGEETMAEPALNPPPDGEASAAAVETPRGSTRGPSTEETPPPELSGSQEMIAQPLSTADEASAAQHASGPTIPTLATSDEQRDQMFQDLEIQLHHHALDEGSVAFTPEIQLPEETQVKESTGFYRSAASPGAHPPLRHATSRPPREVEADRANIAKKLNRAELRRLLERK
jgi:hypothetical protein